MFKASKWVFTDQDTEVVGESDLGTTRIYPKSVATRMEQGNPPPEGFYKIKTAHKFDFSSELQRMSTIVKPSYGDNFILFVKGSPEMIGKLSIPSTLPSNYEESYNKHTGKGRRVIAMAYKYLPDFKHQRNEEIKREEVEKDLVFLGLLIMVNELKPATTPAIKELKEGTNSLN